jgi:glycosyltransferase involved in cell wall biosynthesis
MKVLCWVPVFNEIREFPKLLAELEGAAGPFDELLLVNNGSTDGSEEVVRASGFPRIDLPRNRGVGYANIAAADWGLAHGFDVLVALAGNGKMRPSEMPRLVDPIRSEGLDYVTGSRFLSGGDSPNLPRFRQVAIPLVNVFAWAATGVRLSDATCGYRAYRLDLLRRAAFDWHAPWLETYGFEYYLFAKVLLDRQLAWREVAITMQYPARRSGYSKIRPGRDWWAMLKPWLMARLDGTGFARSAEPPARR